MIRPRVLIVDDTPEIIEYYTELLKAECQIVGTAGSGRDAISTAAATMPDAIVLDISLPDLDGIEVAKQLRAAGCAAVIVFSSAKDNLATAALPAGGSGGSAYVSKAVAHVALRVAIEEALAGREFVALATSSSPVQ